MESLKLKTTPLISSALAQGLILQQCPQCQTVCPSRHLLIRHMIEIHSKSKKYHEESTIKESAAVNNRLPEKSLDLKPETREPENEEVSGQLETVAEIRNFMAYQDLATVNPDLATLNPGATANKYVTVSAAADSNSKPATSSTLPCAYSGPEDHSKEDPIRLCLSLDKIRKTWSISESESPQKILNKKRLDFVNDGTLTSKESSDEEIDQAEHQSRIRTLRRNIYQIVCQIKKIQSALIASGQQKTVSSPRNLENPFLISDQETTSFSVLPAKKKIILQPSFKREHPVSSLKAGLPNVNSTLPLANKRKFVNSTQIPEAKRKFLDKKLSTVKPSSLLSSAPNSGYNKIQVLHSSMVQEAHVVNKFHNNNTMDTKRRFLDMEPSAVKTSLTPDSEDDIQVLQSSIVQEVHAVPNFQNNTKDNLYVRDIPAFNSPTCQIQTIQQANLMETSKSSSASNSNGFQVKELTTDGNSREFFSVGPSENLVIEEDEIDLKENPEYFPFEGPYMCEICRTICNTNREFVHHIRTEHPNEIDADVVEIMEAHFQIPTAWF